MSLPQVGFEGVAIRYKIEAVLIVTHKLYSASKSGSKGTISASGFEIKVKHAHL